MEVAGPLGTPLGLAQRKRVVTHLLLFLQEQQGACSLAEGLPGALPKGPWHILLCLSGDFQRAPLLHGEQNDSHAGVLLCLSWVSKTFLG